jgi:glycosyltransferase involved in cell wall biosynthesis
MFCSTIIPTINRSTLSRAVSSVLDQSFTADDFEVIVVNDSGQPLLEADWQKSERVRVINTQRRERSVARNTGAAVARGRYLHFLDDDDWILPGALESFWTLAQQAGDAAWLYGSSQLVDREGNPLIQLHHNLNGNCFIQVMAGEWIPLQASLIEAKAFFAVGGFNPLISGPEDIDLCRRIVLHTNVANIPTIVACIGMGTEKSTTNQAHARLYGRWAREKILSEPGVFTRMRTSANNSYWYGRIVRAYLTSTVWNLQYKCIFTAASRVVFDLMSFILAGRRLFSPSFWRAIITSYESETFLNGFREANHPLERREPCE